MQFWYLQFRNMLMKAYYKKSGDPFPENPDEENVPGPRVHANVVVVGPIPADSTSIGSSSHGSEKGTNCSHGCRPSKQNDFKAV
jgi:hypothetical protein